MEQKPFINEFFTLGMYEFFYVQDATSFERHIVECLADIYSQEELKKVYDEGNEEAFETLLKKFGIMPEIYENFMKATLKFESFKKENEKNPVIKSDFAYIVEENVIKMFLQKSVIYEPSMEELKHFENDLLYNFSIILWHNNTSMNPNKTKEYWEQKKKILSNEMELMEIKPEYLDEVTYKRFGASLSAVKKMDARMVEKLNKYIKDKLEEEKEVEEILPKVYKKTRLNTAVSSGNGYVDALLIASIIATELSIGFIYLFLHM